MILACFAHLIFTLKLWTAADQLAHSNSLLPAWSLTMSLFLNRRNCRSAASAWRSTGRRRRCGSCRARTCSTSSAWIGGSGSSPLALSASKSSSDDAWMPTRLLQTTHIYSSLTAPADQRSGGACTLRQAGGIALAGRATRMYCDRRPTRRRCVRRTSRGGIPTDLHWPRCWQAIGTLALAVAAGSWKIKGVIYIYLV